MLPYLSESDYLNRMLRGLLQRIIEADVMKDAYDASKLIKINLDNKHIFLNPNKVDVGFMSEDTLKKMLGKQEIIEKKMMEFQVDCRNFIMATVERIISKQIFSHKEFISSEPSSFSCE